jgi:hypothetical protein
MYITLNSIAHFEVAKHFIDKKEFIIRCFESKEPSCLPLLQIFHLISHFGYGECFFLAKITIFES